jgi:hypothetical protein
MPSTTHTSIRALVDFASSEFPRSARPTCRVLANSRRARTTLRNRRYGSVTTMVAISHRPAHSRRSAPGSRVRQAADGSLCAAGPRDGCAQSRLRGSHRCNERPDDGMGVLLRLPDLLRPGSDGARGIFGHATSSTVSDHSLDGTLEPWPGAAAGGRCHAAAGRRRTPPRSGRPRSSCRRRGSRT